MKRDSDHSGFTRAVFLHHKKDRIGRPGKWGGKAEREFIGWEKTRLRKKKEKK